MDQGMTASDSALWIHSCPQRHSRISVGVSQTSTCLMAQRIVAAKVQAAINAETKIPHRIAMACFAVFCRINAIARFIEFPLSYIIGIPRRMADKRFVLIRKDSSGGLKKAALSRGQNRLGVGMDVVDGILTQGD